MKGNKGMAQSGRQTEKLMQRIRNLERENNVLRRDNEALSKINDADKKALENMKGKFEDTVRNYNTMVTEMRHLSAQYKEAIQSAGRTRTEYSERMKELLNHLEEHLK